MRIAVVSLAAMIWVISCGQNTEHISGTFRNGAEFIHLSRTGTWRRTNPQGVEWNGHYYVANGVVYFEGMQGPGPLTISASQDTLTAQPPSDPRFAGFPVGRYVRMH